MSTSSSKPKESVTILLIAAKDSEALRWLPPLGQNALPGLKSLDASSLYCRFDSDILQRIDMVHISSLDQISTLESVYPRVDGLLYVPGCDVKILTQLFQTIQMPQVSWIHCFFAGVDSLHMFIHDQLIPYNTKSPTKPIILTNGRGAFSSSLAEYIMACVLHFNKQVVKCIENKQQKKWDKFAMPVIARKTILFVGFGNIAQTTAKVARAFGMHIVALKRTPEFSPDSDFERADEYFGLNEKLSVLEKADFVVSTLPGTAHTLNFFGPREFAAMRKTAVFISCGRGNVVDEDALADALHQGTISGAALDVYQKEPLDASSPLWECPNLLMTSHNADFSTDYFELGWSTWYSNLLPFMQGETNAFATPVDLHAGY